MRITRAVGGAAAVLLNFAAAEQALAQSAPAGVRVGAGFVANAPDQVVGISLHAVSPGLLGGLGVYVDAKMGIESPEDDPAFTREITAEQAEDELGDQFFTEQSTWRSVNVAIVRPLVPELTIYAGAGVSDRTQFRQYLDPAGQRGLSGLYWVEVPEASGFEMNLLGGAFFRIGTRMLLQFGAESRPRGVTVGASYILPFGAGR